LRDFLSQTLPDYMLPSFFIKLEKIPLTPNGKIDSKALSLYPVSKIKAQTYTDPRNETEERLVEIWAEILKIEKEKIGIDGDFFQMGGHSLKATVMRARIHKEFNINYPMAQLFKSPNIRSLAKYIESAEKNVTENELLMKPIRLLNAPAQKKLFGFPPGIAFGEGYNQLAQLIDEWAFYSFNFIEEEDRLDRYIEKITTLQAEGPYVLLGWSAGGLLAIEIAAEMEKRGHAVSDIILLDCILKNNQPAETEDEPEDVVMESAMQILEELGAAFLKDKVKNKIEKYRKYLKNIIFETIDSNLHLILALQETEKPGKNNKNKYRWDKYTHKALLTYQGAGYHSDMLSPGHLEKNAEIIIEILKKYPLP
ncbi:MAG: hypothetical protein GY757_21770, partial [bacterium]|nr:hypothetical protein [bacterium]